MGIKIRRLFFSVALVAVTFFIAYLVNAYLLFTNQPQPLGQYTGLAVTAFAFIVAFACLVIAKRERVSHE